MADHDTELRFVAKFARLVLDQYEQADRIAAGMLPDMLQDAKLGVAFRILSEKHATGDGADPIALQMELGAAVGHELAGAVMDYPPGSSIQRDARVVLHHWQARNAAKYLSELSRSCLDLLKEDPAAALRATEDGVLQATEILQRTGVSQAPRTRKDIAAAEVAIVSEPKRNVLRASWPYPKMRYAIGDLLPGRMYGITSFPNQGKSTLAANLLYGFLRQGVPTIPIVTEMGDDWLRRAWAAEARVPQFVAENRLWDDDDPETLKFLRGLWRCSEHDVLATLHQCKEQYLGLVKGFPELPCEVVEQSPITPDQVIARLRVLRRKFPGQFVVAIIDHLHNLKYPNDEVDKHVGVAAARIREYARADGAMAVIALFQPKKPEKNTSAEYRPIYARDVRGQVAQVLDVHMSIYRRHVRTTADVTPWGTRKCAYDPDTKKPIWCSQNEAAEPSADGEPMGKLDDEHLYIKPDKRRIGGEGRTIMLDFEADTGRVTEVDPRRYLLAV